MLINTVYIYSIFTKPALLNQPMSKNLSALLARPDIWQASSSRQQGPGSGSALSTGYKALNRALHQGGWPLGAMTEILCDQRGIGELELLLPALAEYTCQHQKVVFISPPCIPYAPALHQAGIDPRHLVVIQTPDSIEQLWAADQLLRTGVTGAVLCWLNDATIRPGQLRKLQLAAQASHGLNVLFRPSHCAAEASPAALRIELSAPSATGLACHLHILKQPGGWGGQTLTLPRPAELLTRNVPASMLPVHQHNSKTSEQSTEALFDFETLFPDSPLASAAVAEKPSKISGTLH